MKDFEIYFDFAGMYFCVSGKYDNGRSPASLSFNDYDSRLTDIGREPNLCIHKVEVNSQEIKPNLDEFTEEFGSIIWEQIEEYENE